MTIDHNLVLRLSKRKNIYPWQTLMISLLFILTAPFVNRILMWIPFLIQLYRIIRFDIHVFFTDMAFLISFSTIFQVPHVGGAVGILIFAQIIWHIIHTRKITQTYSLGFMIILCVYLLFRADQMLVDYIFIVDALLIMWLAVQICTPEDSEKMAKAFVFGMIIASVYGYMFRGTAALGHYLAEDGIASMDFKELFRFRAIFLDSNYYSCALILAIILLLQLYILGKINIAPATGMVILLAFFGVQTYSRTFFVMLVFAGILSVYFLFKNKKIFPAMFLVAGGIILITMTVSGKIDVFNVVLSRLLGSDNLHDMTSGRSDLLVIYLSYIFSNLKMALLGGGLNASLLGKGTHNIYLEILYFTGTIGIFLYGLYAISLYHNIRKKYFKYYNRQEKITVVFSLIAMLVVYFSLQGMFQTVTYVHFMIALLAMKIPACQSETAHDKIKEKR